MPFEPTDDPVSPNVAITHSEANNKGRYEVRFGAGTEPAELTYTRKGPHTIIANHTFVPDALRGRGIAEALVRRLVADARKGDYRIVPLCPYVKALYEKHPEWSDVMR